tara:strand:- start:419 stop:658 length:240 start_codon:yes stop_codon:yes gene_type:complete
MNGMVKIIIETGDYDTIPVCICPHDDNTIREIIEGYEDIWQNTLVKGGESLDPVINNWGGSSALIEVLETQERVYWNHG